VGIHSANAAVAAPMLMMWIACLGAWLNSLQSETSIAWSFQNETIDPPC
jgi:hypothetical protein